MLMEYMRGEISSTVFAAFVLSILFALTVHEFAHAFVAYRAGDETPKANKRVSLNPIDHLDPMGTVLILLAGFGWGKPVPVNPANFRSPRWDSIRVAAAGPASNLATALVCAAVHQWVLPRIMGWSGAEGLALVVEILAVLSVSLALFNLIPVFPLDGHHIMGHLLPLGAARRYERGLGGPMGMLALALIVMTPVGGLILGVPRLYVLHWLGFHIGQ